MRDIALVIAFVGLLIFAAHLFEAVFRRTKIPDVLLLFLIGIILGPILKIVLPSHFGVIGPVFTTVTLVVILFDAGTKLNIRTLAESFRATVSIAVFGFIFSAAAIAAIVTLLTDLDIVKAIMVGAMAGGSSSIVVAPIISKLGMKEKSQTIPLLESTITDVLCVVITMGLIEAYQFGKLDIGTVAGDLISSFVMAVLIGIVSALAWSAILDRVRTIQSSSLATLAFVFVIFGIAEFLGYSGALTALVFGITLGNIELFRTLSIRLFKRDIFAKPHSSTEPSGIDLFKALSTRLFKRNVFARAHDDTDNERERERDFFSEVVFLLKTFFFVYIGIVLQMAGWWLFAVGAIIALVVLLLRVPIVRFSLEKATPVADASFITIMVPRGIAAAALASIPFQQGIEGGELIQSVVSVIILSTIILTTILVPIVERTKSSKFYSRLFSGFATNS
jgi:NhaP-type Na+/H+ or K+/H+ antiporter